MDPWERRRPDRYQRELEAGRGLPLRLGRSSRGEVLWEGKVTVNGRAHHVHLLYPSDFPNRPPLVWETEPFKTDIINDAATSHQYASGALCLYTAGNGPRSWQPDATVADVLERYREFREIADAGQHQLGDGDDLEGLAVEMRAAFTVVVPPVLGEALALPGAAGRLRLRRGHGASLVVEAVWPEGGNEPIATDVRAWIPASLERAETVEGTWHRVLAHPWSTYVRQACQRSLAAIAAGMTGRNRPRAAAVQLLVREPGGADNMLAVFEPPSPLNPGPTFTMSPARVVDLPRALFARVDGAMPDRDKLTNATAVLVGLGSLGGSVAVHLARSGVGRFHLFDPDLVEPENICRHASNLAALYVPKVAAVRAAIHARNPSAQVGYHAVSPLWDGPAEAAVVLAKLLRHPSTLLIVTTADDQVERSLNELAVLSGTPALYASVLGDAVWGRVFRVLPGRTACYQCILHWQAEAPATHPFVEDEDVGAEPRVAGYRQPGIAGMGIDVEHVALAAARLALQTLGTPLGLSYPDADGDHFLLSLRAGWIFDYPLQILRQHYAQHPACAVCSNQPKPIAPELAALERELSEPSRLWEGVAHLGPGRPGE